MLYDVLVIAIFLIAVIIGYNRGVAKTLVSLFGFILSYALSSFLGDFLANLIYDGYLSEAILNSVSNSVANSGVANLATASLPPFVSFVMMLTGFDYSGALSTSVSSIPDALATGFEAAIKPVVLSVLTFVLTALTFLILYFVFRLILRKIFNFVFNLPVLRGLNRFLGAVLSLINAILLVSFIAFLLNLVMPYIAHIPYWLSESTIYNSYIFYYFYSGNIFNAITSAF